MDVMRMHAHCAAMPGAWPDNPWDHDHPVFKVGPGERGKIFAFLGGQGVGVKAATTREVADEWLHRYPGSASVMAYIGRSGWNDLAFDGQIPDDELLEAVDESYRLVVEQAAEEAPPGGLGRLIGRDRSIRPRPPRARTPDPGPCPPARPRPSPWPSPSPSAAPAPLPAGARASRPGLRRSSARLLTTRSRFRPVGIVTKTGHGKQSCPVRNQITQQIRLGIRNPKKASRTFSP